MATTNIIAKIQQKIRQNAGPGTQDFQQLTKHLFLGPSSAIPKIERCGFTITHSLMIGQVDIGQVNKLKCKFLQAIATTDLPSEYSDEICSYIHSVINEDGCLLVHDTGTNQGVVALAMYFLRRAYCLQYMKSYEKMEAILRGPPVLEKVIELIQAGRRAMQLSNVQINHLLKYESMIRDMYQRKFVGAYEEYRRGFTSKEQGETEMDQNEWLRSLFDVKTEEALRLPGENLEIIADIINELLAD